MELAFLIIALVVVLAVTKIGGRTRESREQSRIVSSAPGTGVPRMTSRRKLREILASDQYDTLNDWEKTFCTDVNCQTRRLTWAQQEKIDEIWEGINLGIITDRQHRDECEAAFKLLKEIVESPAFTTLPDKEQRYMQRIYNEGEVSGSYRVRRVQEVHSRIRGG